MTDRELLQQALDALKIAEVDGNCYYEVTELLCTRLAHCDRCGKKLGGEGDIHTCTPDPIGDAQDRLIAELAAQPEQEPVAWMHTMIDDVVIGHRPADLNRHPERWKPLVYANTTPPAAPMTEFEEAVAAVDNTLHHAIDHWQNRALKAEALLAQPEQKPFSPEAISATQKAWQMGYEAAKAEMQPEQEPVVVYQTQHPDGSWLDRDEQGFRFDQRNWCNTRTLYTTPPAAQRTWVGLTDERVKEIWLKGKDHGDDWLDVLALARSFEAELKELNT